MKYRPNYKQMIERSLEHKGYRNPKTKWEPIGRAMEMCGRSGGWSFEAHTFDGDFVDGWLGYNGDEALVAVSKLEWGGPVDRHNKVETEDIRRWPPSAGTMR